MSNIITEGHSILRPPYFDGKNYNEWKERMKVFIQSVDFKIWFVIKNGPKIPTKQIDDREVEKSEDEYDEEDMKNLELEAKARNILNCAMNPGTFEKISMCETAKLMWDTLEREMITVPPTSHPPLHQIVAASAQYNYPDLHFLGETREATDKFLKFCVPLHKHALEGNWAAAKRILEQDDRLKHAAISRGWPTLLHVAAGTNHVHFVKELLDILHEDHVELQDVKGNTAFCFAAASGNMDIARLLLGKNPHLPIKRGAKGQTPIQLAVWQGRCEMAWFLYDKTIPHHFQSQDWELLFFTCIDTGNFVMALKMARQKEELAFARAENGDTALHLLALNQKPLESYCHCSEHQNHSMISPGAKKHVVFRLVKVLWNTILRHKNFQEAINIISEPSQLLFDAAEVGNFGFLSELITAQPSLTWEVDNKNQSIIHTAVSHRHASIFNHIHEIGSLKDIIVKYNVKEKNTEKNTLLHLAAYLAPPGQLELVSGAAFQMCLEIIWFEEVKKIMPPSYIKLRNSKYLTAQELFTLEHEELRKKGEAWMKRTAEFCMIISTVIATAVFSAAINIPGGIDDGTKKPNYLDTPSFLVFAISDATAFISSATATLIFLSILISRYALYDFHKSLPLKLMFGLITLFISITSMMVAFGSAFFITYNNGLKVVPDLIALLASLPMLLYIGLQYPLWSDIIYSTFFCRRLFKPSKPMIYQLEK